jgi:hypothetical protein
MIIAAAILLLLPVSAMAGMTAFMDMDELSNNELSDTTGQVGITLNATLGITGGYIGWGDGDGCGGTTWDRGWVTLSGITATGTVLDGTTIDACTSGATTWLTIVVPAMTINANVDAVLIGQDVNTGPSIGQITVGNLGLAGVTLEIAGH